MFVLFVCLSISVCVWFCVLLVFHVCLRIFFCGCLYVLLVVVFGCVFCFTWLCKCVVFALCVVFVGGV